MTHPTISNLARRFLFPLGAVLSLACTIDVPTSTSISDHLVSQVALAGSCRTTLNRVVNGYTARFDKLGCGDELQVLDFTGQLGPAVNSAIARWRATRVGDFGIAVPTSDPGEHRLDVIWGNNYGSGTLGWYCGTVERNGIGTDTMRVHRSTGPTNCVDASWAATQDPAALITHELGHALGWIGHSNFGGFASDHCVNVIKPEPDHFNAVPCMHEVATMLYVWGIIDSRPEDNQHVVTGVAFDDPNTLTLIPGQPVTLGPGNYRYRFEWGSPMLQRITAADGDELGWQIHSGSQVANLSTNAGPTTTVSALNNGSAMLRLRLTAVAADSLWLLPIPISVDREIRVGPPPATQPYGTTHCVE
jgi:hypothetical protein